MQIYRYPILNYFDGATISVSPINKAKLEIPHPGEGKRRSKSAQDFAEEAEQFQQMEHMRSEAGVDENRCAVIIKGHKGSIVETVRIQRENWG